MSRNLKGVYLPIVTPFQNGQIDYQSYENLIHICLESRILHPLNFV
jgi:4-hydroxy-tetrahydrodipicolinate synthase